MPPPLLRPAWESGSCARCGYALAGLAYEGVCPECALPVRASAGEGVLGYTGAGFVRSLRTGAALVGASTYANLFCLASFATLVIAAIDMAPWVIWCLLIVNLGATVAALVGWSLLTTPIPGFTGIAGDARARVVVRYATLLLILLYVGTIALSFVPGLDDWESTRLALLGWVLMAVGHTTQFFGGQWYIGWIASRIPDAELARGAKRNMWLIPLVVVVGSCLLYVGVPAAMVIFALHVFQLRRSLGRVVQVATIRA